MNRPKPGQPINPTITPMSIAAIQSESPNILRGGHGWVIPNADGKKAACGGPMYCRMCHLEYLAMQTTSRITVMEGWVLNPGDKVLLISAHEMDEEGCKETIRELRKRFPEIDFTIIQGMTGVQVHRAEPDENLRNS